jgi:hypothetical protein
MVLHNSLVASENKLPFTLVHYSTAPVLHNFVLSEMFFLLVYFPTFVRPLLV